MAPPLSSLKLTDVGSPEVRSTVGPLYRHTVNNVTQEPNCVGAKHRKTTIYEVSYIKDCSKRGTLSTNCSFYNELNASC